MKANYRMGKRRGREKRVGGLSAEAERQLRDELRKHAPSEPWVEAQWIAVVERDERGHAVVRRVHDPTVFPPGGTQTAMIRCPECSIFNPPIAFENGLCLDHVEEGTWGPSPSAVAIRALQWRNLRLTESELPPESIAALREEISAQKSEVRSQRSEVKRYGAAARKIRHPNDRFSEHGV